MKEIYIFYLFVKTYHLLFFYDLQNKIIDMSKAKQKQFQKLKLEKQQKEHQYKLCLKKIIDSQQSMRIALDYSEDYFKRQINESLEQYSPIQISRLIFDKELEIINKQLKKLPDQACKIQHFILILLKALKLPFEKIPLYMVGLKDMFNQIVEEGKETFNYESIFKYVVGELIIMKEQQQNTEFHVQFQQKKKQDFLLHDNGIKKVLYSNDCKLILSLDNRQNTIKIYDDEMKNIHRFSPKKQMHNGKVPFVVDFDYSQLTMRLGVIFSDNTIQSIHLPNFINKTNAEFQETSLNELLFLLPKQMKKVYYLQMLNKWLTFSDQINQIYLFDMQKVRLKPDEVLQKITINTNQLIITSILEVIPLSIICIVAGNEISFYNQNFTQMKITKFCHHEIISSLKFCEEKNAFYLFGIYEKVITMFTVNRNKSSFKISTLPINKVIVDFQVFPFYQTLLICDQSNDLRLIHEPTMTVYKQQSYSHIVKMQDQQIRCYKLSKTQFMVYQTYMIAFKQQKIAIQKQMEFSFLPQYYYDSKKEEFYISVNDQILSFSVLYGEIKKNYSIQTSNLGKHLCFFLGKKTRPFVFDHHKNVFELYLKSEELEGQNKQYRKKLLINEPLTYFYDEQMRNFMLVGDQCISQIRNDSNNSFNIINYINLVGFNKLTSAKFCQKSKYITFLTSNNNLFQFKNFQTRLSKSFKFDFQKNKNDPVHGLIIDFHYCNDLEILIILNNKNEVFVIQRLNTSNYIVINLTDYLPFKLKTLNFSKLCYSILREKGYYQTFITLIDDTGFIFDINTEKCFNSKFSLCKKQQRTINPFLKQSYEIKNENIEIEQLKLGSINKYKLSSSDWWLNKVHQKQVAILFKLKIEVLTTLTISKDGLAKLWNQKYQCLFSLKLPNLLKYTWNMTEIHTLKNKKSIEQISKIITTHYSINSNKQTVQPLEVIHKTKKIKNHIQPLKKLKFQEDVPLEIDSKEVEDIILQEQNYQKQYHTSRSNKPKIRYNPQLTTIDPHPWRTKREFVKIYSRASPTNKYSKKMPSDLLTLRVSLDMNERKKKKQTFEEADLILPQLKTYQPQIVKKEDKNLEKKKNGEEVDTFESCLYVKSQRRRKKRNDLDQIDRQFLQKQIEMQNRRMLNRYKQDRQNITIDLAQSSTNPVEQNRYDLIKGIQSVFQVHNKQCSETRKGRIIPVPQIKLIKDYQ